MAAFRSTSRVEAAFGAGARLTAEPVNRGTAGGVRVCSAAGPPALGFRLSQSIAGAKASVTASLGVRKWYCECVPLNSQNARPSRGPTFSAAAPH